MLVSRLATGRPAIIALLDHSPTGRATDFQRVGLKSRNVDTRRAAERPQVRRMPQPDRTLASVDAIVIRHVSRESTLIHQP